MRIKWSLLYIIDDNTYSVRIKLGHLPAECVSTERVLPMPIIKKILKGEFMFSFCFYYYKL